MSRFIIRNFYNASVPPITNIHKTEYKNIDRYKIILKKVEIFKGELYLNTNKIKDVEMNYDQLVSKIEKHNATVYNEDASIIIEYEK